MTPRIVHPHPKIDAVRGCVAIERGPLVYCIEGTVDDVRIDSGAASCARWRSRTCSAGSWRSRPTGRGCGAPDGEWPYGGVRRRRRSRRPLERRPLRLVGQPRRRRRHARLDPGQPLRPVLAIPCTIWRWKIRNATSSGSAPSSGQRHLLRVQRAVAGVHRGEADRDGHQVGRARAHERPDEVVPGDHEREDARRRRSSSATAASRSASRSATGWRRRSARSPRARPAARRTRA